MKQIIRITITVVVVLGLIGGASGIAAAGGNSGGGNGDGGSDKVTICHVPPGNSDNPQTITISENAVDSHLANHPEDRVGACDCQS